VCRSLRMLNPRATNGQAAAATASSTTQRKAFITLISEDLVLKPYVVKLLEGLDSIEDILGTGRFTKPPRILSYPIPPIRP